MTMNVQRTVQTELRVMECGTCGVPFALPEVLYSTLKEDGGWFWCPNGHQRGWGKGGIRSQLEAEKERADRLVAHLDREKAARQQAENVVLDKVKEIKRMQRRAKAGVCQECHRTFQNMARHMETQHAV